MKVTFVADQPGVLGLMTRVAELLHGTGLVESSLLIMRDDTPDPASELPFWRIPEAESDHPCEGVDLEDIAAYERHISQYIPGPHFAGRVERAARGYCAEIARVLPRINNDCFVVWNGAGLGGRALWTMARAGGRPVVFLESGYFAETPAPPELPGVEVLAEVALKTLIWDPILAPSQGKSLIDEEWPSFPTQPGVLDFIAGLKRNRSSKYGFAEEPALVGPAPPADRKLLLAAGQVIYDSSMFFCRSPVKSPFDLVEQVAFRLPPDWFMLFKPHPLDVYWNRREQDFQNDILRRFDNVAFLPKRSSLHHAIETCDAFLAINSTALLEAAFYGKPAIALGTGFCRGRGFTLDLSSLGELHQLLRACPPGLDDRQTQALHQFVSYLAYEYVIPVGSPVRAFRRVEQAVARAARTPP